METFELLYWHWLVLGMLLMAIEIVAPSFIFLWFGVGAIVVGLVHWFIPMELNVQILLWTVASLAFVLLWFKCIRPLAIDKTTAGLGGQTIINETGMVIKIPMNGEKGEMRFAVPQLGNEQWRFITEDAVALGDRVRVVAVSGNSLIVVKA